jgi:hypothetical protein
MASIKLTWLAAAITAFSALSCAPARAEFNVTTYHYDNLRTGWNQYETTLTQKSFSSFGLLKTIALDDQVDAQPLLVNGVVIDGTKHNVLYIATENNSVYAIDAQSSQVLLRTNLGFPVPWDDLPGGCNNNALNVGINGTPVIDTASGNIYVIAFVLINSKPVYYLHALSLTTLKDSVKPTRISASGKLNDGKPYQFNAGVSRQRPALLLSGGKLYAGFGSFCDMASDRSRGWVLGWQEVTLSPLAANELTNMLASSPDDFFLTSVWMSGYGLAANADGSVFFVTGNSDFSGTTYNPVTNISESAAAMSSDLTTLLGLYTPGDHAQLDEGDVDFGSGGLMLLPPQPGRYPNLAAAAGKDGKLHILDAEALRNNLSTYNIGGCWCGPSYYEDSAGRGRIVASGGSTVSVYVNEGKTTPNFVLQSQFSGIANGQNPGFFTSVSSNGTIAGTAVVWAVGRPTDNYPAYVDLYAINPDNGALLFSELAGEWQNTGGDSNIVPVVANGLVYVASDQILTIFGPGGNPRANLPKVRHEEMRRPLPAGEHEIYGTVEAMQGAFLTVKTRNGNFLRIDTTNAKRAFRFAQPRLGHALLARGRFVTGGAWLVADTILHAVDHSVMWPPDR